MVIGSESLYWLEHCSLFMTLATASTGKLVVPRVRWAGWPKGRSTSVRQGSLINDIDGGVTYKVSSELGS